MSRPRPFAAGERALLVDAKARRYLVTLAEGGQFHSHAGITAHDDILGQHEGITVRSTAGARYTVVRPTLAVCGLTRSDTPARSVTRSTTVDARALAAATPR